MKRNLLRSLTGSLTRQVDIRPDETARVAWLVLFLFFLLAANNVIKVVRDSLFLSRFPISQLPYVYLLAALVAAGVIVLYSRYTMGLSFARLVQLSLKVSIASTVMFWLLVTFSAEGWVFYAYYLWSAIVGLILIAQFWTLANEMFTPREAKRLFGVITAGGTMGGLFAGLAANWAVSLVGTRQLLWLVVAFLAAAYAAAYRVLGKRRAERRPDSVAAREMSGIAGTMRGSRYLQTIGAVIFVSVVVSTLVDYQFKATAKSALPSADALASFFASYYGWLSAVTLVAQIWLTGRALMGFGLAPSLMILPLALFAGSIAVLIWPGLIATTANRMAEASLRTSVNQSGVQILYLPVPDAIKKKVKVFMDVTVERLGDGVAALIILPLSLALGPSAIEWLSYVTVALIVLWIAIILSSRNGYVDTLRHSLAYREVAIESMPIDFADGTTVDVVLRSLAEKDEQSVLFALSLAERIEPRFVAARLPRSLLSHESAEVRRRALMLIASSLEPNTLALMFELLTSENGQLRAEAINVAATVLKEAAIPVIRPFLANPETHTRGAAILLMLRNGDSEARREALLSFRKLVADRSADGEPLRIEAARLIAESEDRELALYLKELISDDPAPAVIREAMLAAARRKEPTVMDAIIARLGSSLTQAAAREALRLYGEVAVKPMRAVLFDNRVAHDIRLRVPRTLSKIGVQSAVNALQAGLLEEDRAIRFQVILALDETARRFTGLKIDRDIIESAIMSDALLYYRRLAIFLALFGVPYQSINQEGSLLYPALTDSMERVCERIMWLLALIYPRKDIRQAWAGLRSHEALPHAHAVELLDNLLVGNVRSYVLPIFSDAPAEQRQRQALKFSARDSMSVVDAIAALLSQQDRWLKAAAIWEIGQRGLAEFRDDLSKLTACNDPLLRETATLVVEGRAAA